MTPGTGIRLIAALAACLAGMPVLSPAAAEEDARKVGSGYVISYRHLDLDQPADRRALLEQVEQSAASLCEGETTQPGRDACTGKAITATLKSAPARVR